MDHEFLFFAKIGLLATDPSSACWPMFGTRWLRTPACSWSTGQPVGQHLLIGKYRRAERQRIYPELLSPMILGKGR